MSIYVSSQVFRLVNVALFILELFISVVADRLRPEQMWRLICLMLPHMTTLDCTTNDMDPWVALKVVEDIYKTKSCEEKGPSDVGLVTAPAMPRRI